MSTDLQNRLEQLSRLHKVSVLIAAEENHELILEAILENTMALSNADGGSLYLLNEEDCLEFVLLRTDSLGLAMGGTTGKDIPFPPIPLYSPDTNEENHQNVASHAALIKESVNIEDAYNADGFDFSGTKRFDEGNNYRSKSMLTIPLTNNEGDVIGVLQLINARTGTPLEVTSFTLWEQDLISALAAQAALTLDNRMLINAQKQLLESFIKLIASAIDAKSPYTGGHCERVPVLTLMLAQAACDVKQGPFAGFSLDEAEWYELRIAAWLHDCGKIVTPVHVMDKATKLEAIFDRIKLVKARYEILYREEEIHYLKQLQQGDDPETAARDYQEKLAGLEEELTFLEHVNIGGEFLPDSEKERIRALAQRRICIAGESTPLLSEDEVENLCISRGTLTQDERLVINGHMVNTIDMLNALPFPKNLRRVPEYAGGHHEKMDGMGYPKGVYAGDMSTPARIMAIADVFEALTAQDRPYKKGKSLSESMRIMGFMKKDNHLDPDLFDLFVTSGTYKLYGAKYLPSHLIDEVDEESLLSIEPKPFSLPEPSKRMERWEDFLPEYQRARRKYKLD
jgi:HD-GYP domain-containing protein (c-di-GMP phosphodiesterase class II)